MTKKYFDFKSDKIALIIFFIIFSCGFFLRIYNLSSDSLWIDEGYTIMQTKAVAQWGYPRLISGHIELKDFLFPYLLAPVIKMGEENIYLMRLLSVFFGSFSIIIIYLISKNLFNKHFALLPVFFTSFSYWHIAWSRQLRAYSALVFFLLLAVYLLLKYKKSLQKKYLYFFILSVFLTIVAKSSFGLLLIPALLIYLILDKQIKLFFFLTIPSVIIVIFFKNMLFDSLDLGISNYFFYYLFGYFWSYFGIMLILFIVGLYIVCFIEKKNISFHIFNLICFLTPLIFFSFFSYINQWVLYRRNVLYF